jgi:threonine aldolase
VERGLPVRSADVETNFVQVDVGALGLSSPEATARLAQAGLGLSGTIRPGVLRAVTHLDIDDDDIAAAIELGAAALDVRVKA